MGSDLFTGALKPFAAQAATPSAPLPSGMDAVGSVLGWPSTISSRLTTLSGSRAKVPSCQAVVALALAPVPLAASAGSGPLARTRPVVAASAAAATAARRRALASGRPARRGGGPDGPDGDGGLNDTVASMASARADSPTADCPAMIR